MVNGKNLKLYEPSTLNKKNTGKLLPSIKYLKSTTHEELEKDMVLKNKTTKTKRGQREISRSGLKGHLVKEIKWYSREKVEKNFLHLLQLNFFGTKRLSK